MLDGSVWLRRDLAWVGFALWVALVFRGLPGRWRGAPPEERRRQSRRYLPAFAFRIFLLLAVFIAPLLAVLLFPAAALALLAPLWRSRPAARYLALALGLLPLAVYTLALAVAVARHLVTLRGGFQAGPFALFLLLGAAVTWATSLLAAPRRAGLERL